MDELQASHAMVEFSQLEIETKNCSKHVIHMRLWI